MRWSWRWRGTRPSRPVGRPLPHSALAQDGVSDRSSGARLRRAKPRDIPAPRPPCRVLSTNPRAWLDCRERGAMALVISKEFNDGLFRPAPVVAIWISEEGAVTAVRGFNVGDVRIRLDRGACF